MTLSLSRNSALPVGRFLSMIQSVFRCSLQNLALSRNVSTNQFEQETTNTGHSRWKMSNLAIDRALTSASKIVYLRDICINIEDITRWREDMFEWQEQYLTSERSERVRYCSCHENIKFISSSQHVMFFLLYGEINSTKAKGGNRDAIERYDTHIRKIRHSGPGGSGVWNVRVV